MVSKKQKISPFSTNQKINYNLMKDEQIKQLIKENKLAAYKLEFILNDLERAVSSAPRPRRGGGCGRLRPDRQHRHP